MPRIPSIPLSASLSALRFISALYLLLLVSPSLFSFSSSSFASAAFTVPIKSSNDSSVVEQNTAGTWCYYPAPRSERNYTGIPKLDCDTSTPATADLRHVLATHLHSSTNAISYYSASLQRLGGAEYVVGGRDGKIYLCISGRADDGMYETICEVSTRDNEWGLGKYGNRTVCAVEVAQDSVSDACYAAGITSAAAERTPLGCLWIPFVVLLWTFFGVVA